MFTSLTTWISWCKQWTSHHRKRNGTNNRCDEFPPFKKKKKEFKSRKLPNTMLSKPGLWKQSHLYLRLLGMASEAPKSTKDNEDVCAKLGKWRRQHFCLQTIISALQTAPDKASGVWSSVQPLLFRSLCSGASLGFPSRQLQQRLWEEPKRAALTFQ